MVRHVEKNRSVLVISVTQTDPCLDFLKAALPQALIIHMVRQALPVVLDRDWVRRSALLTDAQLKKPWENDLHYDFKPGPGRPTLAIPWWVPRGRTREFLALPVLGRRLFYWLMMHRGGLEASERLPRARAGDYWRLDYESFAMDPLAAASRFGRLLGASPTARTRQLAREIPARPREPLAPADWSGVPSSLLRQASRLQERLLPAAGGRDVGMSARGPATSWSRSIGAPTSGSLPWNGNSAPRPAPSFSTGRRPRSGAAMGCPSCTRAPP